MLFKNFNLSKYKFSLTPQEPLNLPPYKGFTLRGGFGAIFKRICCIAPHYDCQTCILKQKCAYSYIFKTAPPTDSQKLRKYQEIPRPFIIEPPTDLKTQYKPPEILNFHLILIGNAINYLPYFIFTFQELGKHGIGKTRGKFQLTQITAQKEQTEEIIYSSQDQLLRNIDLTITPTDLSAQAEKLNPHTIKLQFQTPTRIKFANHLLPEIQFHHLIRSLLHRLSALSYFHCNQELRVNYQQLISDSQKVQTIQKNFQWLDLSRYSTQQKIKMKLGGFIGQVTYQGNLKPFLPLILLGQYTHIGKATVFGLGKYTILI